MIVFYSSILQQLDKRNGRNDNVKYASNWSLCIVKEEQVNNRFSAKTVKMS